MSVSGARVGIVGGSIAGCAAAIALRRAGCSVTVFERREGELSNRGYGIAVPVPLHEELVAAGYLDAGMRTGRGRQRIWLVRDGDDPEGRILWRQPFAAMMHNWGVLWRALRAQVPDQAYRSGALVTDIAVDADGATLTIGSDRRERFDLVVGADGYRSATRRLVDPKAAPAYAGYALWRGNYANTYRPSPPPWGLDRWPVTVCFPGGHMLANGIPDRTAEGGRTNWAIYHQVSCPHRFDDPTSLPPGSIDGALVAELDRLLTRYFPSYWAALVRASGPADLALQPVYDVRLRTYVADRVLLIGDAGAVARPHTASGATKALSDALALERGCLTAVDWPEVLAGYDAQRCRAGNEAVELGQRLGRDQVLSTPQWAAMTPEDFRAWTRTTLGGLDSYLYCS